MKTKTLSLKEVKDTIGFAPGREERVDMMVDRYFIFENLKNARKSAGLTQEEASKRTGIPRGSISKIESGRVNITLTTLLELTSAYGKRLSIEFSDK